MKDQTYYWVSLVSCYIPERHESKLSFMAFYARNRFLARKVVQQALEKSPAYLDKYGQLRPFHLLELRQIKEREHDFYEQAFFEMMNNPFPNVPPHVSSNSA